MVGGYDRNVFYLPAVTNYHIHESKQGPAQSNFINLVQLVLFRFAKLFQF